MKSHKKEVKKKIMNVSQEIEDFLRQLGLGLGLGLLTGGAGRGMTRVQEHLSEANKGKAFTE